MSPRLCLTGPTIRPVAECAAIDSAEMLPGPRQEQDERIGHTARQRMKLYINAYGQTCSADMCAP